MRTGFSLLELVVVMALLSLSLLLVVPQFSRQMEQEQLKTAVSEVQAFILRARSLAITHHQNLWLHLISQSPSLTDNGISRSWLLRVTTAEDRHQGQHLLTLSGQRYRQISIRSGFPQDRLFIDGHSGKLGNGSITFLARNTPERQIKVITSYGAGRVRHCSVGTAIYGYPAC
ncbi:prepilin-type N-terminal cleavage/methylation domain-containing protein [Vibrio rhizosphaerae]|uniref:Type II secretion system protein H n=1 Tax=Vibrio rhizosphaerae TaxID=398736 RepID=A0ABU4ISX9_9VIBR|nr:GspH/FimT family pseudopilin [Vibrio rhizosphaerae]MDW6092248.1 prepilin-type N-terminal cleavage/methylation domain-containing protein [Vibrio rhizosphaerae]